MTVLELIEMLGRCPPDIDVVMAYDSMVCVYDVEESESFIADRGGGPRVFLTCRCGDYRDDENGVPIPTATQKGETE